MQSNVPHHLAIIMDGNRRWASDRGLPAKAGHMQGAMGVEGITEHAHNCGISWLTLFAFSTENWKRPEREVTDIFSVFRYFLDRKGQALIDKNVRLRVIGDITRFPSRIQRSVNDLVHRSKENTGINLTVALNYGGMADMVKATRHITAQVQAGELTHADITDDLLKANLETASLPPVDLLVRTSNERRISNFMLWELAYAEMSFVEPFWPDFTPAELDKVLLDYSDRERRFGGDVIMSDTKTGSTG
jgi:undecaprenyl diphosphate synthase